MGLSCIPVQAREPAEGTLEALYERMAVSPKEARLDAERRMADAKARGDRRAELRAQRDWFATKSEVDLAQADAALAAARELGDPGLEAAFISARAVAAADAGQLENAEQGHAQAIAMAERIGDEDVLIQALFKLSVYLGSYTSRTDRELEAMARAQALSAKRQEGARQAWTLLIVAACIRQAGDAGNAKVEAHLQRGVALLDPARYGYLAVQLMESLGTTYAKQGRFDLARTTWIATLDVIRAQRAKAADELRGDNFGVTRARALINLALAEAHLGDLAGARAAIERARPGVDQEGFTRLTIEFQRALQEIAVLGGDYKGAHDALMRQLKVERTDMKGEAAQRIEALAVKFDAQVKEADNQRLRAEQAQLESKRTALALAFALLALGLAGSTAFFVVTLRQRRRLAELAVQSARQAERERIARDLHDTLLQSTQGLILRVHAASDALAPGDPARRMLEETLQRADDVLAEGRDRVTNLRATDDEPGDLRLAILSAAHDMEKGRARLLVDTQGAPRPLNARVSDEAQWIAREALTNAFTHAGACEIGVQLIHGERSFHVCIRDDGDGFDQSSGAGGARAGHWGLQGMQERARAIGGTLTVRSHPGKGTEVELSVPAAKAYPSGRERWWRWGRAEVV